MPGAKILLLAHGFPPNQSAGGEWRAYRTARGLLDRGYQVQVIAADRTDQISSQELQVSPGQVDGIPVQRLSFPLDRAWGNPAEFDHPLIYAYLREYLAQSPPDLVHLISGYRMTGSPIRAAKEFGLPVVVTLTDFWFLCPRINLRRPTGELCDVPEDPFECALCLCNDRRRYRLPYQLTRGHFGRALSWAWKHGWRPISRVTDLHHILSIRRRLLKELLMRSDRLIAPSEFLRSFFIRQGIPPEKIIFMRQGIDISGSQPLSTSQRNNALHIGYIGQIAEHKGVDLLINAFKKLPSNSQEIRLFIHGDYSNTWPSFRRKIMNLTDNDHRIKMPGRFPNHLISHILSNIDVLVVPSRWYENSPTVILESFAHKTPVIASNIGGMAELVDHDVNGLLFTPDSADDLAKQLQKIMTDRPLLNRLRLGIPSVKTIDQEISELEAIYWELISTEYNPS